MKELLVSLRAHIMNYIYASTDPDIDYDVEADLVLEILDEISGIEGLTELHNVCDSMRSDVMDLMRGDNVEAAFALQIILHTLKDLATCHEIINCFTRVTINWRRGISTRDEALADYEQIVRDRLNITPIFTDVHEYTWTEVWDMFH